MNATTDNVFALPALVFLENIRETVITMMNGHEHAVTLACGMSAPGYRDAIMTIKGEVPAGNTRAGYDKMVSEFCTDVASETYDQSTRWIFRRLISVTITRVPNQ